MRPTPQTSDSELADDACVVGETQLKMTSNTTGATAESAAETVAAVCEGRELVVVSNREPYSHRREDGDVVVDRPAGGLTAALDPVMQAVEGTWVAWGDGDADREAVDSDGTVTVPPEDPSYDLRRVWLEDSQVEGYYAGYSNQVLWPICHLDTAKMRPKESFWRAYRETNADFADAILDATGSDRRGTAADGRGPADRRDTDDRNGTTDGPVIWFQDYHLALAPRRVREERPEAFLAHFWHIPWPSWDAFHACPQYESLLDGLLANDLLGFHTDGYCRNFLDSVEAATDARVDRASRSVEYRGNRTFVRVLPLGIDAARQAELADSEAADDFWEAFCVEYDIDPDTRFALGVERLDYTKGIEQRLDALERFWADNPERRGTFTYVQKSIESRSDIPEYQALQKRVADAIERVNDRFGTDHWTPVVSLTEHLPKPGLAALYREADLALVTPVRDGMNLVAKEYVAAQTRDPGVLVLSELVGAADQLGDESVLVHPHDTAGTADAIAEALSLSATERHRRMTDLQRAVHAEDVYAWLESTFETAAAIERGQSVTRAGPER
ncbi:alpha,alpha-trehalose-phosphate synthase (UDP-forming) [Halorussus amylolyticus]|uniref:alpha,alpha-trehalose-phosphate synthase (UDP-forming) n=1 Tax=Halorussus amylolyticus TaxID=1126242 RepID=UPI001EE4857C|nr:trehalose-6-phosphate synthase [Halorussus amylolyticus]